MKFCFGDIVVVNKNEIGVIVKSWKGMKDNDNHDVYCRMSDSICNFREDEIERYMVRHKYLTGEEQHYQDNMMGRN